MEMMDARDSIAEVRRFNRFYTSYVGALDETHLGSSLSLGEVRILYEIAHSAGTTASAIAETIRIDRGYLSRQITSLVRRGLIARETSVDDRRKSHLTLTSRGKSLFGTLDKSTDEQVASTLANLTSADRERLVAAMRSIRDTLGDARNGPVEWRIRTHRSGDVGWVIQRHGEIYSAEYGWNAGFETLVAEIAARFLRDFDSRVERCWIAEREGVRVGSVFLVKREKAVAQLRLLLVDPTARGLGIGQELVARCVRFAKRAGYKRLMLWTNDVLISARRIYEAAGFKLIEEEEHTKFGPRLVSQTWELSLTQRQPVQRQSRGAPPARPRSPSTRLRA
ncbi:MAG TPA: helix-turn-helix domain-containing GNAT family N-acetyltransferase [Gemmatimonadaceae bacterium]|nr:helix-turn-helix domain-containing GNAT family N-acetyltransferase [Gemmatimonadaceae bacterium]